MEQFSSTAYIESKLLGPEKTSMTYPLRCLLNEKIDLAKYGNTVSHIYFAPIVSKMLEGITTPYFRFKAIKGEIDVRFQLNLDKATEANSGAYFGLLLQGLIDQLSTANLPEDFKFDNFKKDLLGLRFADLEKYLANE